MKYIIELEDEPYMREDGVNYYTCKSARWYKLGETIINRLTPYTEPDRKAIEDEVWHLARTIETMSVGEVMNIFDTPEENVPFLCNTMSYREAKAKFEEWLKQKDEIHVGDEVKHRGLNYVVGYVGADKVYHLIDKNWLRTVVQGGYQLIKTGRHFPEVAELLEKMRDDT